MDGARAREKLGAVLRTVGHCDAALDVLERAAATYRARGDLERLGRVTAQIGWVHYDRGSRKEGVSHVQPVLDLLEARGVSGSLAALYPVLGALFSHSCRYTEVLAATARAAELARALGDDRVLAEAAMFRGQALYFMGCSEEALPVFEEAIRVSEAVGDLATLPAVLHMASFIYRDRGEFEQVGLYVERALAAAERRGNPALIAQMLRARGSSAFLRGEWTQAREVLERAVAMGRQLGRSWIPLYLLFDLGRLCLAEGAWADASRYLEEGMALAERRGELMGRRYLEIALAERDVLEGRPDAACARLVSVLEHRGQLEWGVATLLALLAWAYLELGQIGQAEEAVGQALARARATSNRLALVDVLRVQVMLMIHQKHWVEAASNLEEGLALARSMPYPYGEGRLLHVYGAMHVHKGELEPARERLEAALAVFRRLGARKDAERVEQTLSTLQTAPLRAASVPALPSLPARQAVVAGASTSRRLTRTERQAWALEQLRTAGPLSPHAYAAALAVSDDTALRDLQELVDQGLVQAAGTTKDRRYVLAGAALGPAIHRTTL